MDTIAKLLIAVSLAVTLGCCSQAYAETSEELVARTLAMLEYVQETKEPVWFELKPCKVFLVLPEGPAVAVPEKMICPFTKGPF